MNEFLNTIFNTIDVYCPPSSKIDVKALNHIDSSVNNRKDLLDKFPNSPYSPGFIGAKELQNMIKEAKSISSLEFYCNSKSNGKWDFKRLGDGKEYKDFGNYAFGVLSKANGWNDRVRDVIVGIVANVRGTADKELIFSKTFGDSEIDNRYINLGGNDYEHQQLHLLEKDNFKDIYKDYICKPSEEDRLP
jgi:hypothetical protein